MSYVFCTKVYYYYFLRYCKGCKQYFYQEIVFVLPHCAESSFNCSLMKAVAIIVKYEQRNHKDILTGQPRPPQGNKRMIQAAP